MYIYHYSSKSYSELRSLANQPGKSKEEIDELNKKYTRSMDPGPYCNQISFFIEPIPFDIIGDLFGNKHPVWFNGNSLYEYLIDIDSIDKNIMFMVAETPGDMKLIDSYDTDSMLDEDFEKFMKIKQHEKYIRGEVGIGRDNLRKQIKVYLGTTRQAFINARKRPDAKETASKYAAYVPHLMLYPESGIIRYRSRDIIKVGGVK